MYVCCGTHLMTSMMNISTPLDDDCHAYNSPSQSDKRFLMHSTLCDAVVIDNGAVKSVMHLTDEALTLPYHSTVATEDEFSY